MEGGKMKESVNEDVAPEQQVRQFERPSESGTHSSVASQLAKVTISSPEMKPVLRTFEELPPLDINLDDPLPSDAVGVLLGVLENDIKYYVRRNSKPRDRAALALAVSVGSVHEEDDEQGVAHIVEHLAFNATKEYTNHDLVNFLESIGCEFGACNNAYTSYEETVYELLVPVDKPDILSTALHVFAQFSTEIRASEEDLEKERGAVLEEWRNQKNSAGRLSTSYWKLLMEGSKYADRRPIGKEEVIRNVSAECVRNFYRRWYRPENMAVIAVGDFTDLEDVVKLIKLQFEGKKGQSSSSLGSVSAFPVPLHGVPRFSCSVDSETSRSSVDISCKVAYTRTTTIRERQTKQVVKMFCNAVNDRLYKISKEKDPPFFSCSAFVSYLAEQVKGYTIQCTCPEGGTLRALERMLMEVARVRAHGFSEREIAATRAVGMAGLKSWYLQRDQLQSTTWRDNYVWNFLHGGVMPPIKYDAQLAKTLYKGISASQVSKLAEQFEVTCSCVIRTIEPQANASEDDLKVIVEKVAEMERQGAIKTWNEEPLPDAFIKDLPPPGKIVMTKHHLEFDATEISLSNGMRVCYKCTDFLHDEILVRGVAYGGISEVDKQNYVTCNLGASFSREIGKLGLKPTIVDEMLAGKHVYGPNVSLGSYTRNFDGECSPSDLETALQLVYLLFVTQIEPADEEVNLVLKRYLESIKNYERDPASAYYERIRALNFGTSYFYEPWVAASLNNVDPKRACQYYTDCYSDPSTFTVMLVGAINTEKALPLILQYLGGISKPEKPVMDYKRETLTLLPYNPATQIVREEVRREMVESQCKVNISFPIHLKKHYSGNHAQYTVENFMCKFLETKIMQFLRFKHGKVYSVNVSANLPFIYVEDQGHVSVTFSCDPDMAWNLVDLTLEEIKRLQEEEVKVNGDVSTVLELEQREHETLQEDNNYWINRLVQAYLSEFYAGDLKGSLKLPLLSMKKTILLPPSLVKDSSFMSTKPKIPMKSINVLMNLFEVEDEVRDAVRAKTNTKSMKKTLQRVLPFPCTSNYKVVILMPTKVENSQNLEKGT